MSMHDWGRNIQERIDIIDEVSGCSYFSACGTKGNRCSATKEEQCPATKFPELAQEVEARWKGEKNLL